MAHSSQKPTSRLAQYAAIIAKTFESPRQVAKGRGEFVDSSAKFWASQAIRKAAVMGFISRFRDRTFRPQQNLTRVQGLVSLVKGLGLTGGESRELGFIAIAFRFPAMLPKR
ncbi:S-layer homology domain-containing protein [Moorena producens]|uniref:S-layer homology domain-containing protein n=1 Tax=Moorena producens TaxID=1155739 RepID=UPI003C78E525